MIDLYTWTTPNGRKVSILLEELCIPYTVHSIDISKNEQFASAFFKDSSKQSNSSNYRSGNRYSLNGDWCDHDVPCEQT